MPTLTGYFNDMNDPRGGNAPRHKFCDLMTISLLCALCGGEILALRELIVQEGGDCCLQFKANQGDMLADIRAFVEGPSTDYIDEYGHDRC